MKCGNDLDPWTILLSKSRQMKYFHNQILRTSSETAPSDSSHAAGLKSVENLVIFITFFFFFSSRPMLEHSFYWDFQNRDDSVQKSNFIAFIQGKNREIQSQIQQQQSHRRPAQN